MSACGSYGVAVAGQHEAAVVECRSGVVAKVSWCVLLLKGKSYPLFLFDTFTCAGGQGMPSRLQSTYHFIV